MSTDLNSLAVPNPDPVGQALGFSPVMTAAAIYTESFNPANQVEKTPWKVEDYLRAISYGLDLKYSPSPFALHFVNFIKLVNGSQGEENITPVVHFKMLDTLSDGGNRIINLCHRGIAKTTLMGEYLILYLATFGEIIGFGQINLGLYVSDSIDNGVKNMRKNLEFRWGNSEFLRKYVPFTAWTDIRWEFKNIDGKPLIFKGYGAKTGVRGAKELGQRPQIAILDDLISDEDARSPTVIAAVEDTVYKAVNYALHPKRNIIIWSGTPFNSKDPLYKAVESGAWAVNVFPVCEQFPCSREEFRGSWPDRFTYDYVLDQYTKARLLGKLDTFYQELMLRIMSEEDRLIQDHDIAWYNIDAVMRNRRKFNWYVTTDWAVSEKQRADFNFISVWALSHSGDWYWVDGICKKQTMDKTVDDLFRLAQLYRPMGVGIETTGQQAGFIPWLKQEMIERNIYFTLATKDNDANKDGLKKLVASNANKIEKFNTVVPLFKTRKVHFPLEKKNTPEMREMMEELELVTAGGFKSKHDDGADTISQIPLLNAFRPSQEVNMVYDEESRQWQAEEDDFDGDNRMSSYVV